MNPKCPICDEELLSQPYSSQKYYDIQIYNCPRCGTFDGNPSAFPDEYARVRHLISAWIRRQNDNGAKYPLVGGNDYRQITKWFQTLEHMGFPITVVEKMTALLKAFADLVKGDLRNNEIYILKEPALIARIAAKDIKEVKELAHLLEEMGYIRITSLVDYSINITAKGWLHLEELSKDTDVSDSAFIAMWYDDCTNQYRDATIAAIKYCGYKPLIVDQHEFNDFIMDQVISMVKQSHFLIADYTCRPENDEGNQKILGGVRGGVYWEAGLAYGLGKPVIQTCEDSEAAKRRIHFDIDQYRTIFWKQEELTPEIGNLETPIFKPNYAQRLAQHISATIGRGKATERI